MVEVTVELTHDLERGGRMLAAGSTLKVPLDEAAALLRSGFAKPLGAPASFGQVPAPAWVRAWRR